MKKFFSFVALLLCVCCLFGCGSTDDENSVTFGIIGPFTGDLSTYGSYVRNGAVLAIEELNEKGGILGKEVKYLSEDTQGDSAQVISAYNRMCDDIDFLIGEVTSGNTEIVAAQANTDKIPTITPSATASGVTQNREYMFRACFLDPDQGEAMATFTKSTLNATTVAIVYDQADDYSKGVAAAYKAKVEALGVTVALYDGGLKANDNDARASLVGTLVEKNADCVFAPVYYQDAAVFARALRAQSYTKPVLGADGFDGILGQLSGTGDYSSVNNVFFTNHYCATEENILAFVSKYKERFGSEPNAFAALAYDSVMIAAAAMEEAKTTEKEAVKNVLASLKYEGGLTGDIQFDATGDPTKSICICEYVNGSIVLKERITE